MISRETWAWVAILQTVSIASYFCHSVATLSHVRRADLPPKNRGDASAATRIVRGDE